jgi:hypothetical protein
MCVCANVGFWNFGFIYIVVILVLSGNADLVIVGEWRIDECLFFPIALLENAISFPESNDPQYIPSPSPDKNLE